MWSLTLLLGTGTACREGDYDLNGTCLGPALELAPSDYSFWGSAQPGDDGELRLTSAEPNLRASAFHLGHTFPSAAITASFDVRLGRGSGGDGITFTLVDALRADGRAELLGASGGCLGVGVAPRKPTPTTACGTAEGEAIPGWSVELDTWWNDGGDPVDADGEPLDPHGAFLRDGEVYAPYTAFALPTLERGSWQTIKLTLTEGVLRVEVGGATAFEGEVGTAANFLGYPGFTAATGEEWDEQSVKNLTVSSGQCE